MTGRERVANARRRKRRKGSTLSAVRVGWWLAGVSVGIAMLSSIPKSARGQDFDPRGRSHARPTHPSRSSQASTERLRAGPTDSAGKIAQYTHEVLVNPENPFPLRRLAQLYRERDGNLLTLVSDFEARAGGNYAAVVALAGIYAIDGRVDQAIHTYETAIGLNPKAPAPLLALAQIVRDRGELTRAREIYEQALGLEKAPIDRESTLRTLMSLALDVKDAAAAQRAHRGLVALQPASWFVRGELARELAQRGEFALAEQALQELVTFAAGDNRTLLPALTDLGKAQAKSGKPHEALATLTRALALSGQQGSVRSDIYDTLAEVYRAEQRLPEFVVQLEREHPTDFERLALLAALYEETGNAPQAIATMRRALALHPREVTLRVKLIRVLQTQGDLDQAIAEYEILLRGSGGNPQYVFEESEALAQRGDRARALKLLYELEARSQHDEETLSRLADRYGSLQEPERALRVLTRLTQIGTNDPSHLTDLGDRYYQDGNVPLAVRTWKRMLTAIAPRARALAALGEVYLEHEMLPEALAVLREATALEPGASAYKKTLASALERMRLHGEAERIWQQLADKAGQEHDRTLAREARIHLVALWQSGDTLDVHARQLEGRLAASPPNLEAGKTLAEVYVRSRKLTNAEATLRAVIALAPGDVDSYLALERVLTQEGKAVDVIALLEKLAVADPQGARQYYQRMAQVALENYRDDDAIRYATRAVALSPDDAEGHRRLAEMYQRRQDTDRAIVEYRAAISKNDRLFPVALELGELLLAKGQSDDADTLFRRVIRGAPDEDLVERASRLSMQVNGGKGTLEILERDLLPLAIGNPGRKIYRRVLVDVYNVQTFALVQKTRSESPSEAGEARSALERIGARAVKPLLDTLAEGDPGQQRVAIDILGYVGNKNAGPSLLAFGAGSAERTLRTRAVLASGALRDPALLPRYEAVLFPANGASDAVSGSAAWAVAAMQSRAAEPLLRRIKDRGTPEMRAYAYLGLGLLGNRGHAPLLAAAIRAPDAGEIPRAAAAYSLGALGALGALDAESAASTLVSLAGSSHGLSRAMAVVALGHLGAARRSLVGFDGAAETVSEALFASSAEGPLVRQAAVAAFVIASRGAASAAPVIPPPSESVGAEATLRELVPKEFSRSELARAFVAFADVIERSALAALRTGDGQTLSVLEALGPEAGTFLPWIPSSNTAETQTPAGQEETTARTRATSLALVLEPEIIAIASHPEREGRLQAIAVLARSQSDAAAETLGTLVNAGDEAVRRAALTSINRGGPSLVDSLVGVLSHDDAWSLRVLAARGLGRLGPRAGARAAQALREASRGDTYALVRQAALEALATCDRTAARRLAQTLAAGDPEPRVRETAIHVRDN